MSEVVDPTSSVGGNAELAKKLRQSMAKGKGDSKDMLHSFLPVSIMSYLETMKDDKHVTTPPVDQRCFALALFLPNLAFHLFCAFLVCFLFP